MAAARNVRRIFLRGRFQELDFANDIINHYKYLAGYIGEASL